MKVDNEAFVEILKKVKNAVVTTKSNIHGADCFHFKGNYISAYNGVVQIEHPFKTNFNCSIKADKFFKSIHKFTDESELEFEASHLKFVNGKTKIKMKNVEYVVYPELNHSDFKWQELPNDFFQGIELCSATLAKSGETQGALGAICITGNVVQSNDNIRISRYVLTEELEEEIFISFSVMKLLKYFPGICQISYSRAWISLKTEDGTIFSFRRIISENYPYDSVEEAMKTEDGISCQFPSDFTKSIDSLINLSTTSTEEGLEEMVTLNFNSETKILNVVGERGYGDIDIDFEIQGYFPEINLKINPKHLKDILGITDEFYVKEGALIFFKDSFEQYIPII